MKIKGNYSTRTVWLDNVELKPYKSQKIRNHSPDGFMWGYSGSGPSQLALAIMLECGLDSNTSLKLYQEFKWDVIANLSKDDFEMEIDIKKWINSRHPEWEKINV